MRGNEGARLARRRDAQHGRRDDGVDARSRRAHAFRHDASGRSAAGGPRDDFLDALFAAPRPFADQIPASWPTPKNRRATKEFDFLDSLVYRIIAERKAQGSRPAPWRSAVDADGRDGRRRHADDAAAIARRDHDAVSRRARNHGADAVVDLVSAEPESGGGSAAARRTARRARRPRCRASQTSNDCPICTR